jgi:hypothetical protein
MNTATTNNKASIGVFVRMFMGSSDDIPKYIEVFDQSLTSIQSSWFRGKNFTIMNLDKGIYLVRLSLSSGVQEDITVQLNEGEIKKVEINLAIRSPHESHEWAFFTKNISIGQTKSSNLKRFDYTKKGFQRIEGKLWNYSNHQWISKVDPQFLNQNIHADGRVYKLTTGESLCVLEISGDNMPTLFVNLPPRSNLNCLIKLCVGDVAALFPIDIVVATDNALAESLLALITSGSIREATSLNKDLNFDAEELLMGKVNDPIAASIGAYFLLKTGELHLLHDWANNLANLFKWLPDGAIIHAWQMMAEKDKSRELINKIRARFLEAVDRGIPVYTEGLRLLHEGLTQLWYFLKQNDDDIKAAIKKISAYVEAVDWSQETTTYTGTAPDQPMKPQPQKKESPDVFIETKKEQDEERPADLVHA